MPFWRGEGIGRSYELGCMVGAARRAIADQEGQGGESDWIERHYPVDAAAAWNMREYLRAQVRSTGVLPSDRLLLVEGFRDEIGDPRIVVHSCFGRRVNGLLGLVLSRRLVAATGAEPRCSTMMMACCCGVRMSTASR